MNCSTFRRHLNEAEARGALPFDLQEHLDACAACQREWRVQQSMLQALEIEHAIAPAPLFLASVMAKLPAYAPAQRQRNYETVLLLVLVFGGLVATWFASEGLRQTLLTFGAEGSWLASARALLEQILSATLWKWLAVITNTLGEQTLKQGLQVALIALVTAAVAKGAVLLDERLRRMMRRL